MTRGKEGLSPGPGRRCGPHGDTRGRPAVFGHSILRISWTDARVNRFAKVLVSRCRELCHGQGWVVTCSYCPPVPTTCPRDEANWLDPAGQEQPGGPRTGGWSCSGRCGGAQGPTQPGQDWKNWGLPLEASIQGRLWGKLRLHPGTARRHQNGRVCQGRESWRT